MRVDVDNGAKDQTGFGNRGFWGFNVTTATTYTASFHLRGNYFGEMEGSFWSNTTGSKLASTKFTILQTDHDGWVKYEQRFGVSTSAPDGDNTFHLTFDGARAAGTSLHFTLISVFPETWHNTRADLRQDLADDLFALNGKYLRMPGGNNLEGQSSPYLWKWNATLGRLEDRPGRPGTWGYYNTDGFGLLEMMQVLCFVNRIELADK
jgi:alpha-L-arabinofuranosidase